MVAVLIDLAGMNPRACQRRTRASRRFSDERGTRIASLPDMRFVLAALLLAACAPRQAAPKAPADAFGTFLGNYHVSRGPSDPTAPLAMDQDVTEGGGPISMAVPGPVPPEQAVTPTVGERPDTLEQAKGPVTSSQQPATVVAPTVAPVGAANGALPVNPPGTTATPAPATGTGTGTTTAPVQGPVTGAGPNGPGTGTGPATPTGPATGTNTPTPTNPGPSTSTTPAR